MPTKKSSAEARLAVPVEVIARRIYLIRGQKVMLDFDLAELYEVQTRALNQAVSRNLGRFPEDFMFQLTKEEAESLRSQFVISKGGLRSQIVTGSRDANRSQFVTGSQKHRDPRSRPYAFTEQGVAMLSSVLRSGRAVEVNIAIMRTFVQLRRMLLSNEELNRKIGVLEQKYDENFRVVFAALRKLLAAPERPRRRIGFTSDEEE